MGRISGSSALRELETVLRDGRLGSWGDDRLLDRFAHGGDGRADAAFAVLVERHGPRVYRVCRAATGNSHTAEDAFQATFLVLARKAGGLRVGDSLGSWLHGVAARLASSARTAEAKRKRHEAGASHRVEPSTIAVERDHDLNQLLMSEIGRLPVPYREAVFLCDVEGLDLQAAACRLACAVGTVKSRLSRGRKRLRARLLSRGITPAALATSMATSASAAPPRALIESTVTGAMAITTSRAAIGMVPAAAVALFEEGMTMILWTKLRWMIGVVVVAASAATAAVVAQDKPSADAKPASTSTISGTTRATRNADRRPNDSLQSSDRIEERSETIRSNRSPFDPPPQTLDSPSDAEVINALINQRFHALTIQVEKVRENVSPEKVRSDSEPLDKVEAQYKATVTYEVGEGDKRTTHVDSIYLDKSYLRRAAFDKQPVREPRSSREVQNFSGPPDGGLSDQVKATGRRLDEVESKLDRILKALEKSGTDTTREKRRGDPFPLDSDLGDPVRRSGPSRNLPGHNSGAELP